MNEKKNTLLIVDPEQQTAKMLGILLEDSSFTVEACKTGKQAIHLSITLRPDIILIELDLPDMEGYDVVTALREWSQAPVIVLTKRSAAADIVKALDLGADDYVTKPFDADVLKARINACLRKAVVHKIGEPQLINGVLRMDLVRHQVFLNNKIVPFTPKEYDLLRYFMIHCGKMLTHNELAKEIWGDTHTDNTQNLRVFIGQLRAKIEKNPALPMIITTESGIGYCMETSGR